MAIQFETQDWVVVHDAFCDWVIQQGAALSHHAHGIDASGGFLKIVILG